MSATNPELTSPIPSVRLAACNEALAKGEISVEVWKKLLEMGPKQMAEMLRLERENPQGVWKARAVRAENRIAELEKELRGYGSCVDELRDATARIADLTKPRVVDEALVESICAGLSPDVLQLIVVKKCGNSFDPEFYRHDECQAPTVVRAIIAALPANLAPVELTDAECDRLTAVGREGYMAVSGDLQSRERNRIRALLAAAGRYVQPVSAGPATDEDIDETYRNAKGAHRFSLRAVYDLGRKDGRSELRSVLGPDLKTSSDRNLPDIAYPKTAEYEVEYVQALERLAKAAVEKGTYQNKPYDHGHITAIQEYDTALTEVRKMVRT